MEGSAQQSSESDLVDSTATHAILVKLEKRSYDTYLARLHAFKRLDRRNKAWGASLVALSTSTTIASVGLLTDSTMYGSHGNILMVAVAILSLVASLVVSNMNYGARARSMELNYKEIQKVSLKAEAMLLSDASSNNNQAIEALQEKYQNAIELSENHTSVDYFRGARTHKLQATFDSILTGLPYIALAVPVTILIQFIYWLTSH